MKVVVVGIRTGRKKRRTRKFKLVYEAGYSFSCVCFSSKATSQLAKNTPTVIQLQKSWIFFGWPLAYIYVPQGKVEVLVYHLCARITAYLRHTACCVRNRYTYISHYSMFTRHVFVDLSDNQNF